MLRWELIKKTRKHVFDQESDQEKKNEIMLSTKKAIKKKKKKKRQRQEKKSFSWSRACFLSFFLLSCFLL